MRLFYPILLALVFVATLFLGTLFFIAQYPLVDFSVLENYSPSRGSVLLDDVGQEWARFQIERRDPVSLSLIPKKVVQAFIAAEDHDFFSHAGISLRGIVRSLFVNLVSRRVVQGASTITQQLVKLLFTDSQRTWSRKLKEQFLALLVERQFTKEQILEIYLNHIYFGSGIYGVEAACQRFWGKPLAQITLDEAAILAGTIRSPLKYSPLLNPDNSLKTRNAILKSMHKIGSITKQEYDEAVVRQVQVVSAAQGGPLAPYFKEHIRIVLEEMLGKSALYNDDLVIQTTLSSDIQRAAEQSFNSSFNQLQKTLIPEVNGGLLVLENATGKIKALIGGTDFSRSPFNRATQARRQMGSTFKPFIYAAAIESGMGFDQVALDEPLSITDAVGTVWEPQNATHRFDGPMTLAWALSTSNNSIAIKTFLTVGAQRVINLARNAGISGIMNPYPSLALGCVEASVQESASAFTVFANNGIYRAPYGIEWIKNKWGKKIWKVTPEERSVMSLSVASQVSKVLQLSLDRLKYRQAPNDRLMCDAIGKTGTTNDARTCWFIGSTPEYTTAIYIGCDTNKSLGKNVLAAHTTYPLWLSVTKKLPVTQRYFNRDTLLEEKIVNQYTGSSSSPEEPDAITLLIDPEISYPKYAPNPVKNSKQAEEREIVHEEAF